MVRITCEGGEWRGPDIASESIDGDAAGADGGGAVDLLISIARWRLEEQLSRVSSLDTKVTAIFTLNAAVVALFGAALALSARRSCLPRVGAVRVRPRAVHRFTRIRLPRAAAARPR